MMDDCLGLDEVTLFGQDAEPGSEKMRRQDGTHKYDREAFCGKGVIVHGTELFRLDAIEDAVDLKTHPYVCFAYKSSAFLIFNP